MSSSDSRNPHPEGVALASGEGCLPGAPGFKVQALLLRAICACVLLGILVAGLWPFHAPRNEVSWLSGGNGLFFGKHGSIVSASPFGANGSQAGKSCSLAIWLQPRRFDARGGGTILAFYWPASRVVSFALRQWRNGLVLERENQGPMASETSIYVPNVFRRSQPAFFAISSDEAGTAVYVDGTLVKRAPNFALASRDLTGEFIVGNHPSTTYNWSGQVKEIAIYHRELPATEVAQDFADWTAGGTARNQPDSAKRAGVVARYLFDEGKGNVVRNQVDSATNLLIPERFFVLHEQFLERPWDEFRPGWHYWKDVAINIAGFIPLGFFFLAYFSGRGRIRMAAGVTIALGFVVSLTIEVLQAFLPTRDSGMTDLMTNTLGTALGVALCVYARKHEWLARADVFPDLSQQNAK